MQVGNSTKFSGRAGGEISVNYADTTRFTGVLVSP